MEGVGAMERNSGRPQRLVEGQGAVRGLVSRSVVVVVVVDAMK